ADEFGGALSVADARLLLFPMRSLKGTFAWLSCPFALKRLKRDVEDSGLAGTCPLGEPPPGRSQHAGTCQDSALDFDPPARAGGPAAEDQRPEAEGGFRPPEETVRQDQGALPDRRQRNGRLRGLSRELGGAGAGAARGRRGRGEEGGQVMAVMMLERQRAADA